MIVDKSRIESIISIFVTVYPHETSALIYSTSSFFFILSAYFVVLPLRDEGAISLGLGKLPGLFVGSLLLTLVAAPVSTLIFSLPNLSKGKKVTVIASTVASPVGRRRLFAEINSFIAVFILGGQLTLTGRILTTAGVTIAICSAPFFGFINLIALAALPSWSTVAITETLRKVCFLWIVTAFNLGRRQTQLAKFRTSQRQDTQSR
ncbi:UNVERIFIED_CONTAM: hypothetical protein Scaly_2473800 [Sesamum calycinum]|uniref:Uncharacterized protein n=1 Tax=Sesamum calycinum TaxID=2727403 RepID=A0AAW2LTD9_9LAMI